MTSIAIGLEQLAASPPSSLSGQRVGLLCNAASLDHRLVHASQILYECLGGQLRVLFSPQHGLFAEKQDNMVESADRRDPWLNLPVFSLYSRIRRPSRKMFDLLDVLIVDLQDVGTRVYTFIYTMSYCMEAAHRYGKKVIVLDRPNPIGGALLEGNCLAPGWRSFVGRYALPMRHGMTIGELALMFNQAFGIGCELEIIPMQGWQRGMLFNDTGWLWVAPSPNLPTPASALVYPGQVIWEGTNISEGRGTTQPFELFGAPFIEPRRLLEYLGGRHLPGVVLRPVEFEPTAHKWQGQICRGFQLHVSDPLSFRPYRTTLALLQAIIKCYPNQLAWKEPPYEYEYERLAIDLILGDQNLRRRLEAKESIDVLEASWEPELKAFAETRQSYLLYT